MLAMMRKLTEEDLTFDFLFLTHYSHLLLPELLSKALGKELPLFEGISECTAWMVGRTNAGKKYVAGQIEGKRCLLQLCHQLRLGVILMTCGVIALLQHHLGRLICFLGPAQSWIVQC